MATRRISPKAFKELQTQQQQGSSQRNFPKLSEILVNLSVKDLEVGEEKTVRLRLIGDPISFLEYTNKQYVPNPDRDPALKGKTVEVPFPDAEINRSMTRIGHDDPNQCPWRERGYNRTTQFAINVLEQMADKTWAPKILKKGNSVFESIYAWQNGRLEEAEGLDADEAADLVTHLGVRDAPCIRIKALKKGPKPHEVEYSVHVDSKNTKLTDEMIEILRGAGEPKPEALAAERALYEKDLAADASMPEWEDFFAYGFPLNQIFKYTPIRDGSQDNHREREESTPPASLTLTASGNDDEEEDVVVKPKPAPKAKAKPQPEPEEDEDEAPAAKKSIFTEDEESDDDDLNWAQ